MSRAEHCFCCCCTKGKNTPLLSPLVLWEIHWDKPNQTNPSLRVVFRMSCYTVGAVPLSMLIFCPRKRRAGKQKEEEVSQISRTNNFYQLPVTSRLLEYCCTGIIRVHTRCLLYSYSCTVHIYSKAVVYYCTSNIIMLSVSEGDNK